jgi:hypothetical protein
VEVSICSLLSKNVEIRIRNTIIFSYGSVWVELWSQTFEEEDRLRVFEKRALRRISGPKMDEMTEG